MNINNLWKADQLQEDVEHIEDGLKDCIDDGMFIFAKVVSSKLNRHGDSYVSVRVTLREDSNIIDKYLAFTVVNGLIYSSVPLVALCDL
jgi:hypothetical protein